MNTIVMFNAQDPQDFEKISLLLNNIFNYYGSRICFILPNFQNSVCIRENIDMEDFKKQFEIEVPYLILKTEFLNLLNGNTYEIQGCTEDKSN